MRAEAVVEVERRGGRSVCTRLRSDPPVSVRATPDAVHLVASGAGPLGGDEVRVQVRVGAGARLVLRSVGASLVLPGPRGGPSSSVLDVEVGEGGALDLQLQPQIIGGAAHHRSSVRIALAVGATLRWRDETVLGRHAEPGGSLHQRVRVVAAGRPVLVTDLAVGPRWPASLGPGGVAGARVLGSVLWSGGPVPGATPSRLRGPVAEAGVRGACLALGDGSTLASVVAASPGAARAWLDRVECERRVVG